LAGYGIVHDRAVRPLDEKAEICHVLRKIERSFFPWRCGAFEELLEPFQRDVDRRVFKVPKVDTLLDDFCNDIYGCIEPKV
jgi:16S rRNA G527 N7-methylase RsmG